MSDWQFLAASLSALPEGEQESSPGWSPQSRTEPWDCGPGTAAPPRRAVRNSLPNIAGIEFNTVLLQKGNEFRLEVDPLMMFLLAFDVRQRCTDLGASDREGSLALLPREVPDRARFVHPMRGRTLDLSHGRRNSARCLKRKKHVDVIVSSPNSECLHPMFSGNSSDVGPQPRLNLRRNGLVPLLCGEDTMKKRATIGV